MLKRIALFTVAAIALMCMLVACTPSPNNIGKMTATKSSASMAKADATFDPSLTQTSSVLEYSGKDVDPLTLVKCDDPDATVSTNEAIDLKIVGKQDVTFIVAKDGQKAERVMTFTVRDTHAPEIKLQDMAPTVNQGEAYDVRANISSVADPVDGALLFVEAEPSSKETSKDAEKGTQRFYDEGWYSISGSVDTAIAGTYTITVIASDIHGNRATKDFSVTVQPAAEEEAAAPAAAPTADVHQYVLNTNTKKFHKPTCQSVKKMKDKNRQDVEATRDEVIGWGYDPCQNCNP